MHICIVYAKHSKIRGELLKIALQSQVMLSVEKFYYIRTLIQ